MVRFKLHSVRGLGVIGWALSSALVYAPAGLVYAPAGLAQGSTGPSCPVAPPPLSLPANDKTSNMTADHVNLANQIVTARGHVRLEYQGQVLAAPYVRYDRKTSEAESHGGLGYRRPNLYVTAQKARVNVDKRTGKFYDTHYSLLQNGARGRAQQVNALGDNRYRLRKVNYSTCPGPTKAWLLSAQRIDLDRQSGRGVARNAIMKIYGVPVLYSPYLNFPIDQQRHTGLLAPTIGTSSDTGFEIATPYYINLAPNYDATIVPRVMAKRGFELGGQLRYLTQHHKGELDGQVVPYDADYGATRDLVHFQHIGQLTPNIGVLANYTRVSDDRYFDDLSSDIGHTSTSALDRSLAVTAVQPGLQFSLVAQDFQSLDDHFSGFGGRSGNEPYSRLPQARLALLTPTAPFQVGLDAEFTDFRRNNSVNAYRTDLRPRLVWGMDRGGWFARSEAAYRLTHYDLTDLGATRDDLYVRPDQDSIDREIPSFEAGAGLRFSRTLGNGWIQTLEPRAQYQLVGYQDQSNIPIFDAGDATLTYDQLFANNRYNGLDRIGDANQIALGATSRFIAPKSGRTVLRLDLGRVTSFRDLRVSLPNSGKTGWGDRGSNYVAGLMFAPSTQFSSRAAVDYNADATHFDRAIATTTIGRRSGYQLNLGYRYDRNFRPARRISGHGDDAQTTLIPGRYETLSQAALGVRAPIGSQIEFIGRWNYSFNRDRNVEALAGVEYRPSCCYAVRMAYRRYVSNDDGSQGSSILFQFVLRGLGDFGDNVSSFVDHDVFSATPQGRTSDTFDTIRSP